MLNWCQVKKLNEGKKEKELESYPLGFRPFSCDFLCNLFVLGCSEVEAEHRSTSLYEEVSYENTAFIYSEGTGFGE